MSFVPYVVSLDIERSAESAEAAVNNVREEFPDALVRTARRVFKCSICRDTGKLCPRCNVGLA